jgi:hypothetical protein
MTIPKTKRVLAVALEMTRVSLGLADDFANGIIAKRIIEIAETGERHPDLLARAPSRNYARICLETNRGKIVPSAPARRGFWLG